MAILLHSLGQWIAKNKANVFMKTQKPFTLAIQGKTRMALFAILSSCDCKHNIAHGFHNRIPLGSRFHGKKNPPTILQSMKM
jgi:hypothetical protein